MLRFPRINLRPALGGLAVAVAAAGCSPAPDAPASTEGPAPIAPPLTPTLTTLRGNLHPATRQAFDAGRVDPEQKLTGVSLLLRMTPAQQVRRRLVLADLEDPRSPAYHQWLTPERYAAWFGASEADLARATQWLRDQGFTVHGPSRTATRLVFSGTAGQLETAFHTEMHHFEVNGERHFALAVEPSVPPVSRAWRWGCTASTTSGSPR